MKEAAVAIARPPEARLAPPPSRAAAAVPVPYDRAIGAGVSAALVWGVLAFGAVHDWALWPLAAGCALVAVLVFVRAGVRPHLGLVLASAPVAAALALQLVPLPGGMRDALSPGLAGFLRTYDLQAAAGQGDFHPLSVAPLATARGLALFVVFVAFAAAVAIWLARAGAVRRIAAVVTCAGTAVALFALIQKATFNGKIYWFWESRFGAAGNYYGPFVNRNHFAGWMLLASAVVAGYLVGQVAVSGRRARAGWRDRVLWLSSPEASRILLTASALLVMLVALVWSMSRSGMAGGALAILLLAATAAWRVRTHWKKVVASAALLVALMFAAGWKGTDVIASWYGRTDTFAWRVQLWKDTAPALRDFWRAGSGLNTYDVVMLLYPQTDRTLHAAQAHSDYVQLAVEGGLLVGVPALFTIGLLIRQIRRRLKEPQDELTWWIRMGAIAGICGMAVQEIVEFSLQIPGVAVLFAVMMAIAIHEPVRSPLHHIS